MAIIDLPVNLRIACAPSADTACVVESNSSATPAVNQPPNYWTAGSLSSIKMELSIQA